MTQLANLDDNARAVIKEDRYAIEPSELTRARVRRAVESRLTAGAPSQSSPWQTTFAKLCAAILVTAAVAAAAMYKVHQPGSTSIQAGNGPAGAILPIATFPSLSISAKPPTLELANTSSAPSTSRTATAAPPTNTTRSEELAEEIRLLSSANAAINSGDTSRALQVLHEFDPRFANVVLAEERAAAGVLALCAAGRTSEAKAEGKRFQTRWPRSPLLPRLSASCALAK